ncbi:MAG: roadblock/LC7 domain-containing protein [Candidatus Zixiibacteriota bacterium]|nr:MAG: roadblock/LC7 domain-containing protein [candidate division Zixibacteria bacterium]
MSNDSLIILEKDSNRIDERLKKLLKGSEAKCALLVDKDGYLITRQGFTHSLDTTALAALLAGSFASTKEIAKLVGEPEFSVLFHQGKKDHIHMCIVGERSILAVIFDDRTTIGMVRLYAREAAVELTEILQKIQNRGGSQEGLSDEFADKANEKMDDIFQD